MDEKYLEERGYHKYKRTMFDSNWVSARYQKRFDDDTGKKYFLDILEYDNSDLKARMPDVNFQKYDYEFEVYLTFFGDEDKPIQCKMYAGWTLEEAEMMAEKMFQTLGANYYEKWEE